jgi:hypothetical protein
VDVIKKAPWVLLLLLLLLSPPADPSLSKEQLCMVKNISQSHAFCLNTMAPDMGERVCCLDLGFL